MSNNDLRCSKCHGQHHPVACPLEMKDKELKPCPFCGGEARITEFGVACINSGNVDDCCNVCNVFLSYPAGSKTKTQEEITAHIKERSTQAWNRRA